MEQKLIFVDIDGTLVPAGSFTPPESAQRAIRQARANGHRLFLCTGRNYGMTAPLLQYGFDGYVSCAGGYVVCGGQTLFDCHMEPDLLQRVTEAFHSGGVLITLETREHAYADDCAGRFVEEGACTAALLERWYQAMNAELQVLPMAAYAGEPVYKLVFICQREEQLAHARSLLEPAFTFCMQSLPGSPCICGELISRRFDKGRGLRRVCEALGVPLADTVAFGDSMNDWEMMHTAGISVCMADGSPELRRACSRICPPVEQDGLATAFAELGLI